MLGMMNKGGQNQPQQQGMIQNPNLAAMFANNQATAPGGGAPSVLPPIMAPQRPPVMPPHIPPQTPQMPHQGTPAPLLPYSPMLVDGQFKPAYKTSAVQQTGRGSAGMADWLKVAPRYRNR